MYSWIGKYALLLAAFIPAIELLIVLLLFWPQTQKTGAIAATTLLMVSAVYPVFRVLTSPSLARFCGGGEKVIELEAPYSLNFCFILLGMTGIYFQRNPIKKGRKFMIH